MRLQQNPPTTDQEVINIFRSTGYNDLTGKILIGIYECERAAGRDVLDAYKRTLETHIEISKEVQKRNLAHNDKDCYLEISPQTEASVSHD